MPHYSRFSSTFISGLFISVFLLMSGFSRSQIVVSNYTGCPNQIITVNVSWPNVTITSLSLAIPIGGSATNNGNLQTNTTFTISHPGPPNNYVWTIYGTGNGNSGVVTSTVQFQLSIQAPPTLTIANQKDYCPGSSATLVVSPAVGNYYTLTGTQNLGQFPTNVIIVPNLNAGHTGSYQVTSVGTCTMVGTTTINVAPNTPITVNTTSNVCQDSTVNLQASLANAFNWEWFFQSSLISNSNLHSFVATPANSGLYTVQADFTWGSTTCKRVATTQVNVVSTSPVVTSASPSNLLCQNEKLSLLGDAGNNAFSYQWKGPCNFNASVKNPTITSVIPCNAGIYSVTAFFTNNFVTCPRYGTVQVAVVATSPPTPSVPLAACQNKKVQFTVNSSIQPQQWQWFGPNFAANGATVSIDSVKPGNSGPYVVTALYTAGTKTCLVSSSPQQLTVIQVNSITVIPSPTVCTPNNAQLASSAPGAVAFDWVAPDQTVYSGANITIYYPTPTVSGVYTVTAYYGSLLCPISNTVQLTVNPILTFSLEPMFVKCYGDPVTITGPAGATGYSWTSSSGNVAYTKDFHLPSLQTKDAGSYTLQVALGPCKTKDDSYIEVRPPIEFTVTPNSRTICRGDTVFLEVGTNYEEFGIKWTPSLYLQAPDLKQQMIVPMGSIQYNVEAWYIGCNYKVAHTFLIDVLQTPTPTLDLKADRACEPLCQVYNSNIKQGKDIVTFDFGGLMQYQQLDSIGVYHCLPAGAYTLNVITTDTNGCTGTWKYPYDIIVDKAPGADFTWNPEPANTTEEVVFRASAKEPVTYQGWQFVGGTWAQPDTSYKGGGTDTTMDTAPRRRYDQYGSYPVMLISKTEIGCVDTVMKVVNVIDLMNVFIPDAFTPNNDGVNDVFSVVGQGMKPNGFLFYIFNRKGQMIFSTSDITEPWDGTHNGSPCPDGIYTYKIKVAGMNGDGRKEYVGRVALVR